MNFIVWNVVFVELYYVDGFLGFVFFIIMYIRLYQFYGRFMKKKIIAFVGICALVSPIASAQYGYWQQKVDYVMDIDFDHTKHQFLGKQQLNYTNNSPDTLKKVYYHLYFNAFQPGSEMDIRNQNLPDSDKRVAGRIKALTPEETGWHKIKSLKQDGKEISYKTTGSILEVELAQPILPKMSTVLEMDFESQVPIQVRRSGRNSSEGIDYSMSQWYPKMAEYDYMGWHADPYIGREFYGVFGDFDVKIKIDKKYTIGATGYLQNPNEIGKGYEDEGRTVTYNSEKLTWHFKASNVHDFAWGADPDYVHKKIKTPDGIDLHFFYQTTGKYASSWDVLPSKMLHYFKSMQEKFGKYPYRQYSFVQGGDGGMEYPMMTLITGERSETSLVGVSIHEAAHCWFYGILASNESLYPWMDEGFTVYATNVIMNELYPKESNPFASDLMGYKMVVNQNIREIMCTHADWYQTNTAYGVAAYSSGSLFLRQLQYVVGEKVFNSAMLRYFDEWKFKHPTPNDFIRVFEKESDLELDWYLQQFIQSLNTIDYKINIAQKEGKETEIEFNRIGNFPMPIDFVVNLKSGEKLYYTIPLDIMRGHKQNDGAIEFKVCKLWPWVNPSHKVKIDVKFGDIERIEIDPTNRLIDMNTTNNLWVK